MPFLGPKLGYFLVEKGMFEVAAILLLLGISTGAYFYFRSPALPDESHEYDSPKEFAGAFRSGFCGIAVPGSDENTQIHYLQVGDGEDVLLLHGIGASVFSWRKVIEDLSEYYKVTAIDLLGFGESGKPKDFIYDLDGHADTVAQFMQAQGIDKVTLVGSSMGATIGAKVAIDHPQLVRKLVLLAPASDPKRVPHWLKLPSFHKFGSSLNKFLTPWLMQQILKKVVSDHKQINRAMIESYMKPYKANDSATPGFFLSFNTLMDRRLPGLFADLTQPTLVVYGTKDPQVSEKSVDHLSDIITTAKVVKIADCGHHVMEDKPRQTATLIRDFHQK